MNLDQLLIHYAKLEILMLTNCNFVGPLRLVRIGDEMIMIKYVKSTLLLEFKLDTKLIWNTM